MTTPIGERDADDGPADCATHREMLRQGTAAVPVDAEGLMSALWHVSGCPRCSGDLELARDLPHELVREHLDSYARASVKPREQSLSSALIEAHLEHCVACHAAYEQACAKHSGPRRPADARELLDRLILSALADDNPVVRVRMLRAAAEPVDTPGFVVPGSIALAAVARTCADAADLPTRRAARDLVDVLVDSGSVAPLLPEFLADMATCADASPAPALRHAARRALAQHADMRSRRGWLGDACRGLRPADRSRLFRGLVDTRAQPGLLDTELLIAEGDDQLIAGWQVGAHQGEIIATAAGVRFAIDDAALADIESPVLVLTALDSDELVIVARTDGSPPGTAWFDILSGVLCGDPSPDVFDGAFLIDDDAPGADADARPVVGP